MTDSEFISHYCSASSEQQIHFLGRLAAVVTVCARETYEGGTDNVINPPLLRSYNEFQHKITGQLVHLIEGDLKRYSDETFSQIVMEYARELRCENAMMRIWQQTTGATVPPETP